MAKLRVFFVARLGLLVLTLHAALTFTRGAGPSLQVVQEGHWPPFTRDSPSSVHATGSNIYVANWGSGIAVFDAVDPSHVVRRGAYRSSSVVKEVRVTGTTAFLANSYPGLEVLNVSNPTNIIRLARGSVPNGATRVEVVGDHVYLANGLRGFDILRLDSASTLTRV